MLNLKKQFQSFFQSKTKSKLRWLEILLAYYRDNHKGKFEEVMERALHKFFPPEHPSVPLRGEERDRADSRFWDFFIFEYRDKAFKKKTLIEFILDQDNFPSEEDRDYFKLLKSSQLYSVFRVVEVKKGKSIELRDLISGKKHSVKEFLGTLQFKIGDLIFWRIIKDENGDYRLAPGMANVIGAEAAIGLGNAIERQSGFFEKEQVTALATEESLFGEKEELTQEMESKVDPKEKMKKFLKTYNSTFTIESLIKSITNDELGDFRFPKLLGSFQKEIQEEDAFKLAEIWNDFVNRIPRKSLDGKTPEQMVKERAIGPKEEMLQTDLSMALSDKLPAEGFPSARVTNFMAEKFQKEWLNYPQEGLGGRTPKEVIVEERKTMGNPDLEVNAIFNIERACVRGKEKKMIPVDKINAKEIDIVHDIKLFIDFVAKSTVKLTKEGNLKKSAYEKLIQKCKRKGMYAFICGKRTQWFMMTWRLYLDFLHNLAEISGILDRDKNALTVNEENYGKFKKMPSGEQLKLLFFAWFFGDDWSLLLGGRNKKEKWVEDFMFHRETTLANLDLTEGKKEKFEDFFWRFYGSKREFLEQKENIKHKEGNQLTLIHLTIQQFHLFGLLDCFTKKEGFYLTSMEDLLALDSVQVTKIGQQLLPHITEEMFFRGLDQRSLRGEFAPDSSTDFSSSFRGRASTGTVRVEKVSRNAPCSCGSGKKYKKCCGR